MFPPPGLDRLVELAQEFFLALGQVDRRLDDHATDEVADHPAAHRFDALAAHPEHLSGLGPGGDSEHYLAVQGRDLQLATQGRGNEADGDFAE